MTERDPGTAGAETAPAATAAAVDPCEHHIRVARTARYHTLGPAAPRAPGVPDGDGAAGASPPPRAAVAAPREVWFACHGYRQLAGRFVRRLAPLHDGTRLIVAPEALSRFYLDDDGGPHGPDARIGATWMTREDRENEIRDYVEYLDVLYDHVLDAHGIDRAGVRIVVLGFSQGAATASRWAALGHARIDRLILWAGWLAYDLDLDAAADRLRGVGLTFVVGTEDRFSTPEGVQREIARLEREHGIPARLVTFDGGHRMNEDALLEVARR